MLIPKDERLAQLATKYNVAQFFSFSPGSSPSVRHSRIAGRPADESLPLHEAIGVLLSAGGGQVNVRSFIPERDKGNPFRYGLTSVSDAVELVRSLAAEGYSTIVNETIDIYDGGVSGVVMSDLIEFTPEDTPRGVEKPGTTSLPYDLGMKLLTVVYGFTPRLPRQQGSRIEFSIHPLRRGVRQEHTILWEEDTVGETDLRPTMRWPNRFSRFIGDKAFGLLMADLIGLLVPQTTVIGRSVAPFRFGVSTGTNEVWARTCPHEQDPGHYPTSRGWKDPYQLLGLGEPAGSAIASVLAQEGVDAAFSGATIPTAKAGQDRVEGVVGFGDKFMQGAQSPEELPHGVIADVRTLANLARGILGPVRLEFAHDGKKAWVLQLHISDVVSSKAVLFPGTPPNGWLDYDPNVGLDTLRALIAKAGSSGQGIRIRGAIGVTSHVGDLLRRARVPSVLVPEPK